MVVHPDNEIFIAHFRRLGPNGARIVDSLKRYPFPILSGIEAGYLEGVGKTFEGEFQQIIDEQRKELTTTHRDNEAYRVKALRRLENAWRILPKPAQFDPTPYNPLMVNAEDSDDDVPLLDAFDVKAPMKRAKGGKGWKGAKRGKGSSKKKVRATDDDEHDDADDKNIAKKTRVDAQPAAASLCTEQPGDDRPTATVPLPPTIMPSITPQNSALLARLRSAPTPSSSSQQAPSQFTSDGDAGPSYRVHPSSRAPSSPLSSYRAPQEFMSNEDSAASSHQCPLSHAVSSSSVFQDHMDDPLLTQSDTYDDVLARLHFSLSPAKTQTATQKPEAAPTAGRKPMTRKARASLTPTILDCGDTRGELVMLLDTREAKWFPELSHCEFTMETRSLPVGDITWVWRVDGKEIMAGSIIERKALQDLSSSIIDGRYNEQKTRMAGVPLKKAYLIEGKPARNMFFQAKSQAQGPPQFGGGKRLLPMSSLAAAAVNTQLRDNYGLLRTKSPKDSAKLLKIIHEGLKRQGMPTLNTITYEEFVDISRKTGQLCARDVLGRMLRQIPSFGAESVTAVFDALQDKATLHGIVEVHSTPEARDKFHSDLKTLRQGKRALSKTLLKAMTDMFST